jgi:hypothetical protein
MPEEIEAPKIRIVLKAGQKPDPKPDPEALPLHFMRWKPSLIPAPSVAPDEQEDKAKPSTVKP